MILGRRFSVECFRVCRPYSPNIFQHGTTNKLACSFMLTLEEGNDYEEEERRWV